MRSGGGIGLALLVGLVWVGGCGRHDEPATEVNPQARRFATEFRAAYGHDPTDLAALVYDVFGQGSHPLQRNRGSSCAMTTTPEGPGTWLS